MTETDRKPSVPTTCEACGMGPCKYGKSKGSRTKRTTCAVPKTER